MTKDELISLINRNTIRDADGNVVPLGRDQIAVIAHHNAVLCMREGTATMTQHDAVDLMRRRLRMYEPEISQVYVEWAASHFLAALRSLLSAPVGLERG
jgi:hypothetical protein